VDDHALLPAFRLSGPAHKFPLKWHAYMLGAHLVYATGLWAVYEALRPRTLLGLAGALWSLRTQRRISKRLPVMMRPAARRIVRRVAAPLRIWRPSFQQAAHALS
jgi:hypothetical protein